MELPSELSESVTAPLIFFYIKCNYFYSLRKKAYETCSNLITLIPNVEFIRSNVSVIICNYRAATACVLAKPYLVNVQFHSIKEMKTSRIAKIYQCYRPHLFTPPRVMCELLLDFRMRPALNIRVLIENVKMTALFFLPI